MDSTGGFLFQFCVGIERDSTDRVVEKAPKPQLGDTDELVVSNSIEGEVGPHGPPTTRLPIATSTTDPPAFTIVCAQPLRKAV